MGFSIVTFDEAGFRLVPVYKKVWFFTGEKPSGVFFWSNKRINVFGALTDGKTFYHEFHDSMNSLTYKAFLSNFVETLSPGKKYVFVFDNAPYHRSSSIMKYLSSVGENIEVEFLPPYSPELNPTETCWKIIRANVTNSTYFQTLESMQECIESFLENHFFKLIVSNYLCR